MDAGSWRMMRLEDAEAVHVLDMRLFRDFWPTKTYVREITETSHARWMVLESDGEVIGFAGMWLIFNEAMLLKIGIAPEKQGRGWGRMLLEAMIQLAADSGMEIMTLEVRKGNTPARNLYRRTGFEEVGLRPGYYENGEDAVLMTLSKMPEADFERDPFLVRE